MKLEFFRQILKKYSNFKFHENPSSGSRIVSCGRAGGQTDSQAVGHVEANTRFSPFCERT
jgi:hypothetical protein